MNTLKLSVFSYVTTMGVPLQTLYEQQIQRGLLTPDAAQDEVMRQLDSFCRTCQTFFGASRPPLKRWSLFSSRRTSLKRPQGIYLWGDVGQGKTTLIDLVLQALDPLPYRRIHGHAWLQELSSETFTSSQRLKWAKHFVEKWPILFLDEMEITHIADGMLLQNALTCLWEVGLIFLTTSNTPPTHLYPKGMQRELLTPFFHQLETRLQVLSLEGTQDYRQHMTTPKDLYCVTLNQETETHLQREWDQITHRAQPVPHTLSFSGRTLQLARTAPQVCWLTFEEVCRAPLGLRDYKELIRTFPRLILSDIPRLTRQDADAIRRLIMLIDLLYEARHPTLFSAAASPEDLILDPGKKKSFARTASRLQEMRFWTFS